MNKISPSWWLTSCVVWKPKVDNDVMLSGIFYSLFMM